MSIFATIADQLTKVTNVTIKQEKYTHERLRDELAKHKEGLTVAQLAKIFNRNPQSVRITLRENRGVYVAMWFRDKTTYGRWTALWKAGDRESEQKPRC